MKSTFTVIFLIALVSANTEKRQLEDPNRLLQEQVKDQSTQDFITGLFLALRAAEFCPHAFGCVSRLAGFQKTVDAVKQALVNHATPQVLVKSIQDLIKSFETSLPDCKDLSGEGLAYVNQVKNIIANPNFPLEAAKALVKNKDQVAQDLKDYKSMKAEGQWLVAGMKVGEIGRIMIWGAPAE